MKRVSEKSQVLQFVKSYYPEFVSGLDIERWAVMDYKMKAATAGRRVRELVREGYLERGENENHNVKYKYIQPTPVSKEQEQEQLLRYVTS